MTNIIRFESSNFVWIHRTVDLILPFLTLILSMKIYGVPYSEKYILLGIIGSLAFVTAAQLVGTYQSWRGRPFFTTTGMLVKAWFIAWGFLIILSFLLKNSDEFSRVTMLIWAVINLTSIIGYRLIIRGFLQNQRVKGLNTAKIAIIGAGQLGQQLAKTIDENPWLGYQIIGFYDDNPKLQNTTISGHRVIGMCDVIHEDSQKQLFNEVFICLPLRSDLKIRQILNELTDSTTLVKFVPDFFSFDLMHARWIELKGMPIISVYDTALSSQTSRLIKRTEDIILSTLILILILPIMVAISIAIKMTSPGPVIFKQKRYGLNGKEINVYKFRTMNCLENDESITQATKNDPRTTPFGGFLRRTSLDELPQFYNVIQGKMSIVGPRPHASAHNEEYRKRVPKYMQRHLVKPGITGWAQINGWRGETDTLEKMEKRIQFDLHYINNWSLWLDIKIIILTLFKGFINKNAY